MNNRQDLAVTDPIIGDRIFRGPAKARQDSATFQQLFSRWVYVGVAGLFVLVALAGFGPTSAAKIAAVRAGLRPAFPAILHLHAVLMGAWLLLVLAQASLATTGRRAGHRVLGLISLPVLLLMLATAILLVLGIWQFVWNAGSAADPAMAELKDLLSNVLLAQLRMFVTFPAFIIWALLVRRRDPETHKRLLLLATALPLQAAFDRLSQTIGITTLPGSALVLDIYMLICVAPLLVNDLLQGGRLHRATWIWLAVNLPFAIAVNGLWGSAWWLATAPRLMGVA